MYVISLRIIVLLQNNKIVKNTLLITILAFTLVGAKAQQNPEHQIKTHQTIDKLQKSLIEKNFSIIKNALSPDFKYNDYSGQTAVSVMGQIVQSYPLDLKIIRVLGVFLDGDDRVVSCKFIAEDGGEEDQEVILDSNFKIKRADIVTIQAHNPHKN